MSNLLRVYLNGSKVLEYDKQTRLPGKQRQFLDSMDQDMDEGIELNGENISSPGKKQRVRYVAMHLLHAIETETEGMIGATCAWLAQREPALNQVLATEQGDEINMELLFGE